MKCALIYALCLLLATPLWPADAPPLRGHSLHSSRIQQDWEAKFRALPDPAAMRAYMQRLSARPHHVGSPYDKDNAEWIAAKFKEFGLDGEPQTVEWVFPPPQDPARQLV